MKSAVIIFSLIFISNAIAYKVEKIESFDGWSEHLEFDSNGNAYVVKNGDEDNRQLWKISPTKEVLLKIDISEDIYKIIINSYNDVYVIFSNQGRLFILNEKTLSLKEIDSDTYLYFALDNDGNLFYNDVNGIYFLKRNSTIPVLIKNLEYYHLLSNKWVDTDIEGNTYIGVNYDFSYDSSVAIITKESKEKNIPYADLISLDDNRMITLVLLDQNQNLLIMTYDPDTKIGYIQKLVNNKLKTIFYDEDTQDHKALIVEDRIYLIAYSIEKWSRVYFITSDEDVVQIPELNQLTIQFYFAASLANDKDGNVYVDVGLALDPPINSTLAFIKQGEVSATGIEIEGTPGQYDGINSYSMMVDEDDVLWFLKYNSDLFYVKKGAYKSDKLGDGKYDFPKLNRITNEVYLMSRDGLYYVSNDSV